MTGSSYLDLDDEAIIAATGNAGSNLLIPSDVVIQYLPFPPISSKSSSNNPDGSVVSSLNLRDTSTTHKINNSIGIIKELQSSQSEKTDKEDGMLVLTSFIHTMDWVYHLDLEHF